MFWCVLKYPLFCGRVFTNLTSMENNSERSRSVTFCGRFLACLFLEWLRLCLLDPYPVMGPLSHGSYLQGTTHYPVRNLPVLLCPPEFPHGLPLMGPEPWREAGEYQALLWYGNPKTEPSFVGRFRDTFIHLSTQTVARDVLCSGARTGVQSLRSVLQLHDTDGLSDLKTKFVMPQALKTVGKYWWLKYHSSCSIGALIWFAFNL